MLSVILALTVIFGIALTNLFLGFASAMLIGRGPKSWSDLDSAVTVHYFSPGLVFPRAKRAAEPVEVCPAPEAPITTTTAVVQELTDADSAESAAIMMVGNREQLVPPARPAAWDPVTQKLVLPPAASPCPEDEGPAETVFERQFETWRMGNPHEPTSCLSGFMVTVKDAAPDAYVRESLLRAVQARIVGQVRKDRRVLRIADNQLIWFSNDVHPDEGLMPVERIRQLLGQTRFRHEDTVIEIAVQAAVVAVSVQDNPAEVIRRIQATLQYALEKAESSTCVDVGHGPGFVQPTRLELDETECVLE